MLQKTDTDVNKLMRQHVFEKKVIELINLFIYLFIIIRSWRISGCLRLLSNKMYRRENTEIG